MLEMISLFFIGLWLIIDGVVSIVKYRTQTLQEQLIRVIRIVIGLILMVAI